jgi:hypothetical protein
MGLGTFVSGQLGDDDNPGTVDEPLQTIAQGIDNAAQIGGGVTVYVADAIYAEDLLLVETVSLAGGYKCDTTGFLLTAAPYADFDLDLEFFVTPDANSGVFIRCANPGEIGAATCYEVNIFDQRPDPTYRTGGIVEVAAPKVVLETGDRWNHYEISAHGSHLVVKLNGQTTVDTNDDKLAAGPFALQYGAGRVMFRNVRIRSN